MDAKRWATIWPRTGFRRSPRPRSADDLAPTTRARYADACRRISEVTGKVRLRDLRADHVEKVRERLLASGLAPQTVSDVLRVLSQALGRAEARGLAKNWAAASIVSRPVGDKPTFTTIDRALGSRLLAAVVGIDPWDAAVHLALGLGLRREEILALRWADVSDTVKIHRTLTWVEGKYHIGPPKSEAGEREIPLPAFVAAALKRHRAAQAERLLSIGLQPESRRRQRNRSAVDACVVLDGMATVR